MSAALNAGCGSRSICSTILALEDRLHRPRLHRRGGAVDEQRAGGHGHAPLVQLHRIGREGLHAAQAHHVEMGRSTATSPGDMVAR